MNSLPIVIGIIALGLISLFFLANPGIPRLERISEDNLTLMRCTGDRFSFIQGTYLFPVTEEEISREKEAVHSSVSAMGGSLPRAGGSGGGGGGPGQSDPRVVAWGYCVDEGGVPSVFNYVLGRDSPSNHAIEKSNQWYRDEIVNRSLAANGTCTSRTVVERFRSTGTDIIRIT